jgi:hypothetical protein
MAPVTSPKAVMRMTGVAGDFSPNAFSTSKPPARSIRTSDSTRS